MTVSLDRIKLIDAAVAGVPTTAPRVAPTQAQLDAAFVVSKAAILAMVQQLVPAWAMGYVEITDAEIHAISDPTAKAVVNS